MRFVLVACVLVGCATAPAKAVQASQCVEGIIITHGSDSTSLGEVVVPGTPAEVYATLTAYNRWPEIFPTIIRVDVADNQIHTVARSGRERSLVFANDPEALVIRFEERNDRARVRATITLEPTDDHHTRIRARLFAEPKGGWRLLVSDDYMRRKRHDELAEELGDVRGFFAQRRTAVR